MTAGSWLRGALVGATAMYFLDPERGRRRRALTRDRAARLARDAGAVLSAGGRDLKHRARGLAARTRQGASARQAPEELVLIERVRSRLGRVVAHPHALQVGALDGRVVLSGPILAAELEPLLAAVREVPGVRDVESHLDVHDDAGSVPSLQGGRTPQERSGNVLASPAVRAAGLVAGSFVAVSLLRRSGTLGWLGMVAAAIWASRGTTRGGETGAGAGDDRDRREAGADAEAYPAS